MFALRKARLTPSASLLRGLVRKILEADRYYRQMRKLSQMPDDRLLDMGISRDNIRSAFRS